MDCEQAVALLSARLDHEIQPNDRVPLDLHLRDCPVCRATADAFALQHQELRGAFEPRRQAAAATAKKVNAQLPVALPRPQAITPRSRAARAAVVLAAVAAAVALVLLTRQWFEPPEHPMASDLLKPLARGLQAVQEELTPRPRPEIPPTPKLAVGESVETKAGEKRRLALPDGSILYVNEKTKVSLDADRHMALTTGTVYVEASPRNPADAGARFTIDADGRRFVALGTKYEVQAGEHGASAVVTQGRVKLEPSGPTWRWPAGDVYVQSGQQLAADSFQPRPAPRGSHLLDWTRDLMAAAEAPLVPASEFVGCALVAVDPYGQEAKLSVRNYHIDVHVEDGFARTTIDQTYFNNTPWRLEGTFYFPLPPEASLSRLAMYVDGNLMEGGMTDRDWGNSVYEKVVRSQRDPALLEWVDGGTFKMRVFPLEGRQEKRIILRYTQRLPTLYGRTEYRFPSGHSLQMVDHWSFHAVVKNGDGLSWSSPTHPAMRGRRENGDLVLDAAESACKVDRYVEVDMNDPQASNIFGERLRFSSAESDGNGYLMMRFRPELPARSEAGPRAPHTWVFLVESSADRDPLLARTQIEIVRHMQDHIDHEDRFVVLTAATETHLFQPQPFPVLPDAAAGATAFLEGSHLVGALDLGRALTDLRPFLDGDQTYLVHVGSGYTAMGRRQEALAEMIPAGVHYIGVGVGKHWNRSWMKDRAENSGGYFTQINPDEPVAWRAFDLVSTLNTPRLLHVQVTAGLSGPSPDAGGGQCGGEPRFLTDQSLVAQGEEVCAVAQVPRSADGALALPRTVIVTGLLNDQPYRRELPVQAVAPNADYLPRTWAKLEIDRLLAEDAARNKEKIVELSKAMYVMTPFTSLLVLENEAMYKEFKVDRGRKDHWAMYPCSQTIPIVFEPDPTQPIDVRNAPKTPKPVVNLVLPTVVTRQSLRFLGSPVAANADREDLLKQLKEDLSSQERLLGHLERNEGRRIDRLGGRLADQTIFFSELAPNELTSDLGIYEPAQAMVVKARIAYHSRQSEPLSYGRASETSLSLTSRLADGLTINTGLDGSGMFAGREAAWRTFQDSGGRIFVAGREVPPFADKKLPDMRFGATYSDGSLAYLDATAKMGRADTFRRRIESGWTPTLLYQPPTCSEDPRLFSDLVAYAPGLNTTDADVLAVLDAEAAPNLSDAPGHIDPEARRLIEQSRRPRWRVLTLGGDQGAAALHFYFDGAGRYVYEHNLPLGLHERVVCDGETLWHLYPELGLAARRTISRFHRAEIAGLTPWALPPVEDLCRGADVEAVDPHTVALVPLGAKTRRTDDDKPAPYYRLMLVFADDGRLTERRWEEMPSNKVMAREIYDGDGGVRVLDADGKEVSADHRKVADAPAPDLSADVTGLVVVRMPLRSRDRVFGDLGLDSSRPLSDEVNGCYPYLEPEQAVELLAGAMTEGNAGEAAMIHRDCFEAHGDQQRGLFTLLAAAGVNLCAEPAFQQYLSNHKDDPLAQYFALLGNGMYAFLHGETTLDLGEKVGAPDGFLRRLAEFHDLQTRWDSSGWRWIDPALRRADEARTFDYIRRNHDNAFGWALQIHVQNHARTQPSTSIGGGREGGFTERSPRRGPFSPETTPPPTRPATNRPAVCSGPASGKSPASSSATCTPRRCKPAVCR